MIERWRAGAPMSYPAVRATRPRAPPGSSARPADAFYRLINAFTETTIVPGAADFLPAVGPRTRRRSARCRSAIASSAAWCRGSVSSRTYVRFQAPTRAGRPIEVHHAEDRRGSALDAVFSFSAAPMRMATRLGVTLLIPASCISSTSWPAISPLDDFVRGWGSLIGMLMIIRRHPADFHRHGRRIPRALLRGIQAPAALFLQADTSLTMPSIEEDLPPLRIDPIHGGSSPRARRRTWECADCGFRFATPPTNPNFVTAIGDYEGGVLVQCLGLSERRRASDLSSLCDWMQRITPLEGRRLLDIGAGSGKLVRFLRARRVEAHGIEPSRALFDRFLATEEAFTCAMLDRYRSAAAWRLFDIVTAFDVIEHVPDPVAFLGDVAALVEPGGMFFASTPDAGSLPARAFGRRWHFYYPYLPVVKLAPRSLARAAEPQGLHIVDCRHRGRVRSAGYMIRYAAEFIAGVNPPHWARWFDRLYVPINLIDTMYVAFKHVRE